MKSREQLEKALAALEIQRSILGEQVYATTVAALRAELAALPAPVHISDSESDKARIGAWLYFQIVQNNTAAWQEHATTFGTTIGEVGTEFGYLFFESVDIIVAVSLAVEAGLQLATTMRHILLLELKPVDEAILRKWWDRFDASPSVGSVYISNAAYQLVRGVYIIHHTEHDDFHMVVQTKQRAFPIGHTELESISPKMIGREREFDVARGAFERAIQEKRAVGTLVIGTSGVGKSRLLLEIDKWLELEPMNAWHLEAQATETTRSSVFGLIRDMLSFRFQIEEEDDPQVARDKLVQGVTTILGEETDDIVHLIGQFMGYDFSASPYMLSVRGDSQLLRETSFSMLLRLFRAAADQHDALVYLRLDDIHAADAASLDVIQYLLSEVVDFPLVVVATAQPSLYDHFRDDVSLVEQFQVVNLRSLSEAATNAMLDELFEPAALPDDIRRELVGRTAGNPYHVEEALRLLLDEGILFVENARWYAAPDYPQPVNVPSTIDGVLQARINSFSHDAQTILRQAAVIGYVFWDRTLHYLQAIHTAPHNPDQLGKILTELHSRGMIAPRLHSIFSDATEYKFQQVSVHRVVYSSVRQQQARRFHLRIAQWLIGRTREGVGEIASLIALHFARANDINRAIKWYALAAQEAFAAYLSDRALQYYELAFDLLPDSLDDLRLQIQLYEGYGRVLASQGRYTDALAAYTAVCMAAEKADDLLEQSNAWNAMSKLQNHLVEPHDALTYAERAAALALSSGEAGKLLLGEAYLNFAVTYSNLDQPAKGLEWVKRARDIFEAMPNQNTMLGRAYNVEGECMYHASNYNGCLDANLKALDLLQDGRDKQILSRVLNDIAFSHHRMGNHSAALDFASQAYEMAQASSARHDLLYFTNNYGIMLAASGQYEAAETRLYQVVRVAGPLGWWGMVGTYHALAQVHLGMNKLREAQEDARYSLIWANQTNNASDLAIAWRLLGVVAAARRSAVEIEGRMYEAEDCFANSKKAVAGTHHHAELAHTLWAWGDYLRRRDPERAQHMLQEAKELFLELKLTRLAESIEL